MKLANRRYPLIRFVISALCGAILGCVLGLASAQERPPGQLDTACAAQCVENGNDEEFCTFACWVPDPEVAARSEPVHWPCYSTCREKGGRPAECLSACRKR